jgi:hypothetical protein
MSILCSCQSEETVKISDEIPLPNRLPRDMTKTPLTTPHPPEGSVFMRRRIATSTVYLPVRLARRFFASSARGS